MIYNYYYYLCAVFIHIDNRAKWEIIPTKLAAYERNRYIEHGVYFVVSGKYVYLPFLLINARDNAPVNKKRLQPAAQYILLYHLQKGLEGGINALSFYSDLNPERMQTKVMYDADFRKARETGELPELKRGIRICV